MTHHLSSYADWEVDIIKKTLKSAEKSRDRYKDKLKAAKKKLAGLDEILYQIIATEESYDDEQTVLGEIYDKCREALTELEK